MTKKDYIRAAEIAKTYYQAPYATLGPSMGVAVENAFVALFRGDNDRFDVERFREACKPKKS